MTCDVLYLAWNRIEFTKVSFGCLLANTDWTLVDRLVVYDDGSKDGTREWLEDAAEQSLVDQVTFRRTSLRSPVAIMCDYLATSEADVFAKIDNDIAVPSGWLASSLDLMRTGPELDLLGLAAGWTGKTADPWGDDYRFAYQPSSHIGGVGLMRRAAFERHPDLYASGRFGLTEWQHAHPDIVRGWIAPDLPVVQLDLIPEEPWASLADYYVSKGWARKWPPYDPANREWWDWIPAPVTA